MRFHKLQMEKATQIDAPTETHNQSYMRKAAHKRSSICSLHAEYQRAMLSYQANNQMNLYVFTPVYVFIFIIII